MNKKITLILFSVVVFLGIAAYMTHHNRQSIPFEIEAPGGARVLTVDVGQIQQIRVQRDFWNSFTLTRQSDGSWRMTEPSNEPAKQEAARRLAQQLSDLPAMATIDTPSDDSERYREYGLWEPELQITVTTIENEWTVSVGSMSPDRSGYYCTVAGVDDVYVTPAKAIEVLKADLSSYRQASASAQN